MSGFRVDSLANASAGEALLLRTFPLDQPVKIGVPIKDPPFGGSINYKDVYYPFVDALIVSAADGSAASVYRKERPVAQECMLTWCVKTFKSSYAWGNYKEEVTATFLNMTKRQQPFPWNSFPVTTNGGEGMFVEFRGNISIYPPSTDISTDGYGVSNETFSRIQSLFEFIFPSTITVADPTAYPWWRIEHNSYGVNNRRAYDFCPWLAPNNVTRYMEQFAKSMTDVIRSHKSNVFVSGLAYNQVTFVAVHWEWLILPLALLLFSLVFLVATMIKTAKGQDGEAGLWKTSAMPTLIYSLPEDVRKDISPANTWGSTSSKGAKNVRIRLLPNQGWRVSGHKSTLPTQRSDSDRRPPPGWI